MSNSNTKTASQQQLQTQTNNRNVQNQNDWLRQVQENLAKNDEQRRKDTSWFHLEPGQKAVIEFTGEFGPVWKDFDQDGVNERLVYEYKVIEVNNAQAGPKTWDLSKRWSEMIDHYLKQGERILRVERVGAGMKTMYYFSPISGASNSNTSAAS
jgi:hypothetical protein